MKTKSKPAKSSKSKPKSKAKAAGKTVVKKLKSLAKSRLGRSPATAIGQAARRVKQAVSNEGDQGMSDRKLGRAAIGAATGAVIGTVAGPIGTAVGGAIGATIGALTGSNGEAKASSASSKNGQATRKKSN